MKLQKLQNLVSNLKNGKLGWITIMVISVGTTIGAGIFFKNGSVFNNAHHQLGMAIASWAVSGIGMLAIGLALIELSNANANTSEGVLAWSNAYSHKWFRKTARGFMYWVYTPLNFLAMPIYVVMSVQDATGVALSWIQIGGIGIGIALFFLITSGLSTRFGAGMQWLITLTKLLPIIAVIILGFQSDAPTIVEQSKASGEALDNGSALTSKAAALGVFASMPAILFAFDGFYMSSSLSKDMKNPSKLPLALFMAIVVITGIYILITAAIGDRGSIFGIGASDNWSKTINIGIAIAVMGIVNGFAIGTPKMLNEAISNKEIAGYSWLSRIPHNPGLVLEIVITLIAFIIFVPIGAFTFEDGYGGDYAGSHAGSVYSLIDLLTNWTSLLVFAFIGTAIFGATLEWYKSNQLKSKGIVFIISSMVAMLFLTLATIYKIVDAFYDLGTESSTGNVSVVCILFATVIVSISVEIPVKDKKHKVTSLKNTGE